MLRAFEPNLRRADDPVRRRRRRCIPSLSERASCLEDRVLLSAAGGQAHAAEVARNPAHTRAGKEVVNLFESILQTSPTGAQLTRWAHKLRDGMSVAALRRDLTAQARAQQGTQASMNVTMISGDPTAPATRTMGRAGGEATISIQMMEARSNPTGPNVVQRGISQIPPGMTFTVTFAPRPTPTSGVGSPAAPSMPASPSPTPPAMSPMPTTGGMGPSSGTAMPTMGSTMTAMGSMAATAGSTSTMSTGIGMTAMLPISPMPVAPFSPPSMMTMGM